MARKQSVPLFLTNQSADCRRPMSMARARLAFANVLVSLPFDWVSAKAKTYSTDCCGLSGGNWRGRLCTYSDSAVSVYTSCTSPAPDWNVMELSGCRRHRKSNNIPGRRSNLWSAAIQMEQYDVLCRPYTSVSRFRGPRILLWSCWQRASSNMLTAWQNVT